MLSQVEAAQLLDSAARASNEIRLALLRRLVGELPAGLWPVFGLRVLRLAQVPRGAAVRGELIELIAGLPIRQKYPVLLELAQDSSDPDDQTVMRALLASLRRDGLPVPSELWGIRGPAGPAGPAAGSREFDRTRYQRVDEAAPADETRLMSPFDSAPPADIHALSPPGPAGRPAPEPGVPSGTTSSGPGDHRAEHRVLDPADPVYPRLDVPWRAAPGVPFRVVAGLRPDQDPELVGPGRLRLPAGAAEVELRLVLAYDPYAFVILPDPGGPPVAPENGEYRIVRTAADPFPSVALRFVALAGGDLAEERRIDVSFVRDGVLIGFASREIVVGPPSPDRSDRPDASGSGGPGSVSGPGPVSGAGEGHRITSARLGPGPQRSDSGPVPLRGRPPTPPSTDASVPGPEAELAMASSGGTGPVPVRPAPGPLRPPPLFDPDRSRVPSPSGALDLTSLLDADRPDLVIVIRRSAAVSGHRLVFTALSPHHRVRDLVQPRTEVIIGERGSGVTPHELGMQARAKVATTADPFDLYTWLLGMGRRIYRSMPSQIRAALAATVTLGTPERAATVLVLSDEPYVPWELAARPGSWPGPAPGGESPFLGAHVAISRWLVTDEPPPEPRPPVALDIHRTAVVTARYEGTLGADPLPHAEREAARLIAALRPAAVAVRPALDDVLALINGDPAADLMHFALHGRFDPLGVNGGLILPPDPQRPWRPEYPVSLDENHVRSRQLGARTFVYLNACQIAAGDNRMLGDYGGMAAAFLEAGAGAVLAPLWNITDHTAAAIAEEIYRNCLGVGFPGDPGEPLPGEPLPGEPLPGEPLPGESLPGELLPVAEALRRIRARYTERAVRLELPGVDATLVSFQMFGHPRLRLRRGR